MPQIIAVRTKDDLSPNTIAVVLSQDAVCLGPDGQPWAGVSLNAQLARSLAQRLLGLAREIEVQEEQEAIDQPASRPLAQITSILVLHDGSGQGHRAFSLALDLASRSLASIQLVGIYGMRHDRFEPSSAPEDYEWQRGWLEKLVAMYCRQAEQTGVDLQPILLPANDERHLSDVFDNNGFDLIMLPRRFSDIGALNGAFLKLHQQFAGAKESTILLCP